MKRAFLALALVLLSITGCKPEFEGQWNGHCLEVVENGEEFCFVTVQQASDALGVDFAVARMIFINAQQRYAREQARETARTAAQR